jgi:hypothetical protein
MHEFCCPNQKRKKIPIPAQFKDPSFAFHLGALVYLAHFRKNLSNLSGKEEELSQDGELHMLHKLNTTG